jgi:hypothetical protein
MGDDIGWFNPSRTPQEQTKLIREAVHEMLERFPPKR